MWGRGARVIAAGAGARTTKKLAGREARLGKSLGLERDWQLVDIFLISRDQTLCRDFAIKPHVA